MLRGRGDKSVNFEKDAYDAAERFILAPKDGRCQQFAHKFNLLYACKMALLMLLF